MPFELYLDESGYTGERHLDPAQPVFVLASLSLNDAETTAMVAAHFGNTQAAELKHSRFMRGNRRWKQVVGFIDALRQLRTRNGHRRATFYGVHKKFLLMTLMVDLWIEPAMRRDGIDLYRDGGNLGFSNLYYYVMRLVPPLFDALLQAFEEMSRQRTEEPYNAFWRLVYGAYHSPETISPSRDTQEMVRGFLVSLIAGEMYLGPSHLLELPDHALDVAASTISETVHYWDDVTEEPLRIVLDESKYFAESRWIWERITQPDLPAREFHAPGGRMVRFPLKVESTNARSSLAVRQLQLADLISGAGVVHLRGILAGGEESEYAIALERAGIRDLLIGAIATNPRRAIGKAGPPACQLRVKLWRISATLATPSTL